MCPLVYINYVQHPQEDVPLDIKELSYNAKQFRSALRAFLYSKSLYILDEYFNEGCLLVG
jgi:hypothetical protein